MPKSPMPFLEGAGKQDREAIDIGGDRHQGDDTLLGPVEIPALCKRPTGQKVSSEVHGVPPLTFRRELPQL